MSYSHPVNLLSLFKYLMGLNNKLAGKSERSQGNFSITSRDKVSIHSSVSVVIV